MVVVGNARDRIGSRAEAEITSVLPSAGGKMVFARVSGNTQSRFQVDLEICVYSRRGVDHNDTSQHGAVAQLIERVVRNDEVVGLIPICSTIRWIERTDGLSSSAGGSVAKLLRRHPSGLIPRREGLNFSGGN